QGLSAVLCFRYLRRMLPELLFRREDARLDRALLKKSLSFGLLSALHQSSLYIGKLLVQGAVNSMGTGMIAAYTATTRIEGFANSFGDSGAAAVSLFVAQNVGNRDGKRAREGFRKGFALLAVMGVALSVILYVTAYGGVVLMTGETGGTVVENGAAYMRLIAWFYVLCFVGNAFVGWFRGLGMVNIPVIGTCLHISIRVVLSWLLIGRMGLAGVALATGVGWVCVVTFQTLTWRFSRRQRAILNHV
ncbi:MAG: MATE family efflux transporter, partial [Dysosmobacter sp.]